MYKQGDILIVRFPFTDGLSIQVEDKDVLESLPLKSFIRVHKIFTISEKLILSKLTSVQSIFLTKLNTAFLDIIRVD